MKKILFMFVALMLCGSAFAKPQSLSWTWPTGNCDGTALDAADFVASEIAYDVNPMPMPSDDSGPCADSDGDAPATATIEPVDVTASPGITLNLMPGMTYYARIRLSAYVAGNWSSWSTEHQFTVPYGKPNRTIWLN